MRLQPFRIIAQCPAFPQIIIHTVRLNIGFIIYIQSILITQLIKTPVLGIMRQTDSIQIIFLHQFEVFTHDVLRNIMPRDGIMLMNIDPFELDRLSIEQQNRIGLSVSGYPVTLRHLYPAETDMKRNHFQHLPASFDRHQHRVQIRDFRTPSFHIRQSRLK